MGWNETGWKRSLQISVTRTEPIYPYIYPPITTIYNGQSGFTYNGTWETLDDTQLAQLPSGGTTGFTARIVAYKAYLESYLPLAITNNIIWANARLGATVLITFIKTNATVAQISLYWVKETGNTPLNAAERIQIKLKYRFSDPVPEGTAYVYIEKGTTGTTLDFSVPVVYTSFQYNDPVTLDPIGYDPYAIPSRNLTALIWRVAEVSTDIVNVSSNPPAFVPANTTTGAVIAKQYVYTVTT